MKISITTIENDLANGRLTLNNIKNFEDISARAANRGFTAEQIDAILLLHQESLQKVDLYKAEIAAQIGLTDHFKEKEEETYDFYIESVEIARLAFEGKPGIMKLLGLTGKRSQSFKKWTAQALRFFKEVLSREDLLQDLLKFNLTKEDLEKGLKLVEELLETKYRQEEQKGKVQAAYNVRNKVYKLFRKPMRQLRKILRIEYKKEPQQLERLGIRAYSEGYVKAETRRKNEEKKRKEAEEAEAAAVAVVAAVETGGQTEVQETAAG